MRIPLSKPIWVAGRQVSELELREQVTAGDIWDLTPPVDASGQYVLPTFGAVLSVAARLAGLPEEVIRALPVGDAQALYGAALPLVLAGHPGGSAAPESSSSTAA